MDALGIGRAHVCGLSLGGVVAIAMHAAAPERCASLIIADSFAVHPDGQAIHDRSVAASQAMTMRELAEARTGVLLGSAATPELRAEVIDTMAASILPPTGWARRRFGWPISAIGPATIDVPTLILVGEEDGITPPALSEELHELIARFAARIVSPAPAISPMPSSPTPLTRRLNPFSPNSVSDLLTM